MVVWKPTYKKWLAKDLQGFVMCWFCVFFFGGGGWGRDSIVTPVTYALDHEKRPFIGGYISYTVYTPSEN